MQLFPPLEFSDLVFGGLSAFSFSFSSFFSLLKRTKMIKEGRKDVGGGDWKSIVHYVAQLRKSFNSLLF